MKKAVIILPTYNEKGNIENLIHQIVKIRQMVENWDIYILVVDSLSDDGTKEAVLKLQKKFSFLHLISTKKEGLGRAYIAGFKYAIDNLSPYILFEMDADLSHDPKEIPNFLKKIEKGADFVVGARYIRGGSIPKNWELHRKILSILANLVIKFGFMKLKIHDWTSGYRAIKTWLAKEALFYIKNYSGYVFQVAFLDFVVKKGAIVDEVPIKFKERKWGISKINAFQYIWQTLIYVFLNSSFIKFVIVGTIGFLIDFGISFLLIEKLHQLVWVSTLISTEMAIISNFLLNNFWSFSHKKINSDFKSYFLSFIKFNLVSSGSILIQTGGIQTLAILFSKNYWYIYKIFIIIFVIIPYSYFLYNKVVWKEKK